MQDIDLSQAEEREVESAPVAEPEPLSGKERAGVNLTWGLLAVISAFMAVMLGMLLGLDPSYEGALTVLRGDGSAPPPDAAALEQLATDVAAQQVAYRGFWTDTMQLVLLNVLFPTLTALLGYVFGTTRAGSTP